MLSRTLLALFVVCLIGLALPPVAASARGMGGFHGGFHGGSPDGFHPGFGPAIGPSLGHGLHDGRFYGSYSDGSHMHGFYGHGWAKGGRGDGRGQRWARNSFGHDGRDGGRNGYGEGGHFGHWQPGRWQQASGFGHSHWSQHADGVWSR